MKRYKILPLALAFLCSTTVLAQTESPIPDISYTGRSLKRVISGFTIEGMKNTDDRVLISLSGLSVGQQVTIPGDEITNAVKRFWKSGLFSDIKITVDTLTNTQVHLGIKLEASPRVSEINFSGIRSSEEKELTSRIGLLKGNQITPNMLNNAKRLITKYFSEKGFKNIEVHLSQRDDISEAGKVILDIVIDKKAKVKVRQITIEGNEHLALSEIKGTLIKAGCLKKTKEKGKLSNIFKSKKFIDAKYQEDKENIIARYNELGFRDAEIVADSVTASGENTVDIHIKINEGNRYYVRNIEWVGNTLYSTEELNYILRMKKGDVYNQKFLKSRTSEDDDAIGSKYYNNGYVFYQLLPVEVNIVGDSVDLEMRVKEGQQATINYVRISGNDRVYENVVRRELRSKPGDLFNRDALMRSLREIASMGHFDPENISPDIQPSEKTATVDINWGLTSKSNDQVEFSLGWGQTGVIGKIGLRFANFSMRNLFGKKGLRRGGFLPQGDGETFSISGQTNGRFYQSYNISYLDPWFGGKLPNSLSTSIYYSKQTGVHSNFYNSAYYNNYNNYLLGTGTTGNSRFENYYDPDTYVKMLGASIGWGKRLRWPDDYFFFQATANFTRYMLKEWSYFIMSNGNSNNVNINLTLARNSTDNQIFPRTGSEFSLSLSATPPFSLWDGKDYAKLANNTASATYQREMQEKHRWVEYHKWKFRSRTYTALSNSSKGPVLMTRVDFGILGSYNKHKKSPFETFYVGGDGTSGYSTNYATETIGLRGYDNGALTPQFGEGYAYTRLAIELRYPLMLQTSTQIYALTFLEGGNAWTEAKHFNPFDMKRSAGVGVRLNLPMVGLLGVDWAYGFDKVYGIKGGSQIHLILGQEF